MRVERIVAQSVSLRDGGVTGVVDATVVGLAVRVLVDGMWGFASHVELTPERAAATAERAVEVARALAPRRPRAGGAGRRARARRRACGAPPTRSTRSTCRPGDKVALLADWSRRLLAVRRRRPRPGRLAQVRGEQVLRRPRGHLDDPAARPHRARRSPRRPSTAPAAASRPWTRSPPPAGRGWEYLDRHGWDWDAELAAHPRAGWPRRSRRPVGRRRAAYDLVIDPTNLWLTIHESVGHATEYDRAIGYEAAYAGTSFATPDQLGTLRYGSDLMHVTGDRTIDARPGDHRLRRRRRRHHASGTSSATACSSATSSTARSPPASAWPAATAARSPTPRTTCRCSGWPTSRCSRTRAATVTTDDLIAGRGARHLRRRRQVVVDRHAALQLPVHRPALLPDRERRLAGQLRDVAYQAHHHGLLGLARRPRRPVDVAARAAR